MKNNKNISNTAGVSSRRQLLAGVFATPLSISVLKSSLASAEDLRPGSRTPWPLWALQKSGQVVYLTGQTPPRPTVWSDARIEKLIESCGAIWTETNNVFRDNPRTLVQKYGLNLEGPLSKSLTVSDYADVRKAAEIAKIPLESIEPMRPWLAASQIESAYFREKGLKEQGTAERVLLSKVDLGKIRHASEFGAQDDVVRFMGAMSKEEDVQFLQYTLKQVIAGTTESERIFGAWAAGDQAPAAEFVSEMKRLQPNLYAKHVVGRNSNWLPRFAEMQKEAKPSFVVVGLFHMAGPDSLLEYLKQDGWKAKRLFR
ncbi:TraB/GumN family protein [Caulobacter sp. ErkDOM-E]|uniref:TraB/GumN family protein n=1 Tax=Caulobacter sp. ErkDOM-E TaxID=3402778 RepID=UPI003AF9D6BF